MLVLRHVDRGEAALHLAQLRLDLLRARGDVVPGADRRLELRLLTLRDYYQRTLDLSRRLRAEGRL